MKLTELSPRGQDLPIRWPDSDEETGIVFKVVSADSKQFFNVVTKHAQEALGREKELPIPERQKQTAEQVAACIVGWTGIDDLTYSPENAVALMENPEYAFIREQVEGYVVKRSNFFRAGKGKAGDVGQQAGEAQHAEPAGGVKTRGT